MGVFGIMEEATLISFLLRTIIVGVITFIVGRFMFKRVIDQLTYYDFVLLWMLGAIIASPLLDGEISFTYTVVPLITLVFWHYLLSFISIRSRKFAFFFNGKPIILIEDGKVLKENLKKYYINIDLLISQLRIQNIFDISQVKYTILEPSGKLSIIKKEIYKPVTPSDLKMEVKPLDLPLVIINDGRLFEQNLYESGVDKKWLMKKLSMEGINHVDEIYLATIDSSKRLYISRQE